MDISSIGARQSVSRSSAAHLAAVPVRAATPQASQAEEPIPTPRPAAKKTELVPLDVQVTTRPDGGRQLTIVDKTTGQIYCQLPPERMVEVLEDAMRRMQNEEEH